LRVQLHLQFAAQNELFEQLVLADVRGNHFFNLAILQQQPDAEVVDAGVIADNGKVLGAFAANRSNKIFRNAAQAEPAHQNRHAIAQIGDGSVGGSDAFVHGESFSIAGRFVSPLWGFSRAGPDPALARWASGVARLRR
jgi:hypothetical protein